MKPSPNAMTHRPWYKSSFPWAITAAASLAAFTIGWFLEPPIPPPQALRVSGYQFIDPLLLCDINNSRAFPEDLSISSDIQSIISARIKSGDINKASTYFIDLRDGKWSDVNENERYYPSSLGKIPIMIAYYEQAENYPGILTKEINYTGGPDLNQTQDIKPAAAVVAGQTYTVEQLIEYMIKYSDNNAAMLLYNTIDHHALDNIYHELNIPTTAGVNIDNLDSVNPGQVSELFRILYNATYISRDYSEQALKLMSESSFTQGLVAGVPQTILISHKFGLVGIASGNITIEHELHDCGIVYATDPYVLCVMIRGSSSLDTMESVIAQISKAAFQDVENGG